MRLTDAGSAFHAAWKPATFVSSSSLPVGMTTSPAKCETTNTVWIAGCLANHFGTWSFHCRHSAWRLAGSFVVARMSGQPERVIDTPRQRLRCATYSSAARQCDAWLSPTSAIVARSLPAGTPNSHGPSTPSNDSGVHGEFCEKIASSGGGTIAVRSLWFTHRRSGWREAGTQQRRRHGRPGGVG